MTVDLDDVTACPRAAGCDVCGEADALDVHTITTPVGVPCVTLCAACAFAGRLPRMAAVDAVRRSLDHCAHLGIDADVMAAVMRDEEQADAIG